MKSLVVSCIWCVLTVTLGPPLCALNDEGGHPSVVLEFQLMFGSARHLGCTKLGT